ncbi:MAG: response regulator [Oscillochloris sp.]|nr:response regulator [Oscillochloris sp.]
MFTACAEADNYTLCGLIRPVESMCIAESPLQAEASTPRQQAVGQDDRDRCVHDEMACVVQAKDAFLSTMSHELRTPLSAILGLSESLSDEIYGPLTTPQRQVLSTIQQSGGHLLTLINDILDMAKIDAGKLDLQIDRFLVSEVCQASLRMIHDAAYAKGVQVSFGLDNPQLTLSADPRRLKQILFKLLSNAVKFTPEGGHVSLTVSVDPEHTAIRFAVRDTGIGISAVAINQLFMPFSQLDSRLSRQYEGSGIGLALVRQMVDLHGGSVQVESQGVHGQGSCFTVSLPWQESGLQLPTVLERDAYAQIRTPRCSAQQPQAAILLVEDNISSSTAIREYLSYHGYAVVVAYNGSEGLQIAREQLPALILMDIQMPVLDGLEATRQLRADATFARTPIIALTALAMPGDRERCLEAGANAYLTKPIGLRVLLATIQQYLQKEGVTRTAPHA